MISIERDESSAEFLDQAGALLYQREPENSLMIGLAETLSVAHRQPPLFLRILEGDHTVSAAIQTPPHHLILTLATTAQLRTLATYLFHSSIEFPGIVGPAKEAQIFSEIWTELTGHPHRLAMDQKLYKVISVEQPSVLGQMRLATPSESELCAEWLYEFAVESIPHELKTLDEYRQIAETKIKLGFAYFWEVGGEPVSAAQLTRPTAHGISVAAVFTPKSRRKQGYASALVAKLSEKQLASGKAFCTLYTDATNPTSNQIYQKIGYKEVARSRLYLLGKPAL